CEQAGLKAVAEDGERCGGACFGECCDLSTPLRSGRDDRVRGGAGREPLAGHIGGTAEGDDSGDVFRAGTALALVRAAVEERSKLYSLAREEHPGALRSVHLVPGDREKVDVLELTREVERQLRSGLYSIGVDDGVGCVG